MASAFAPSTSVAESRNYDESIQAQDSEIVKGVKQTTLGGNSYIVGDGSTVTDSGAFDMVGQLGLKFLQTVGGLADSFANSTMEAVSTLSSAASPTYAQTQATANLNNTIKTGMICAAIFGVAWLLIPKKRK